MSAVKTNLGAVTAYADARKHGYTGTREQFGEDQAKFATNATSVAKDRTAVQKLAEQTTELVKLAGESEINAGLARDAAEDAQKKAEDAADEAVKKLSTKEDISNKVSEITEENADDVHYPSAKAVNAAIQEIAKTVGKIDSITVNGTPQPIENKTANLTVNKTTVGLGNVDNTSDADKPISNATQTALSEKLDDDEVYDWAKAKLPFTANEITDTYNPVADCFVTNPTNFADGKPYFRYHAGSKSFTWTNPNPIQGKVTITVLAWKQWDKDSGGDASTLNIGYSDGTSERFTMKNGEVSTFTTNSSKTLSTIKGNYDLENWVLLDLTVLKIVYDDGMEAPFALKAKVPEVVSVSASATAGQAADAKSVYDMIGDVKSLIDAI